MTGKKIDTYNLAIVLYAKKEQIYSVWASKYNSKREKQVIFLMISKGEGRHYPAV